MMPVLESKVALVTGAGRGIGRANAERLARDGASLIIVEIDGKTAMESSAAINKDGGTATPLAIDVAGEHSGDEAIAFATSTYGGIDILVNNAGIAPNRRVLDTTLEEWERVLRVNLTGTFLFCKAAAPVMAKRGGGRIVNIASISGQRGGTGRGAYGTSKAGMLMLTRIMAVEFAPENIAVNAIAPGPIRTDITDHSEGTVSSYLDRIPMRRYGTTGAIAAAVAYLVSPECDFTTGVTLNVDGGFDSTGLIFSQDDLRASDPE
jgi:3-oxoacyl-[acyl-carrier protein] reductase